MIRLEENFLVENKVQSGLYTGIKSHEILADQVLICILH